MLFSKRGEKNSDEQKGGKGEEEVCHLPILEGGCSREEKCGVVVVHSLPLFQEQEKNGYRQQTKKIVIFFHLEVFLEESDY